MKDLELTLNQAKSESDDQAVSLKEELERKQTDLESLKEEMRAKDAANSEMEFQIKKYVSSEGFDYGSGHIGINCTI